MINEITAKPTTVESDNNFDPDDFSDFGLPLDLGAAEMIADDDECLVASEESMKELEELLSDYPARETPIQNSTPKTTIATPEFKLFKRLVSPIEIDMHNIKGRYANGNWHEPIQAAVKYWAASNQFQGKATVWSRVMPSSNFGDYSDTCCIVAFGMAGFMKQLEIRLGGCFWKQVRRSDEILVKRSTWRPYLHLEHGKIWTVSDGANWEELE